ncbi:MAG: hypothetical protein HZB41_06725 [Ignavibacteriae bacterium]|nr:hypothetical protein [Ignavibacteriota bacterium]
MKKFIIIIFITSFCLTQSLFSQQDTIQSNKVIPQDSLGRHLWYIEFFGVNYGLSINYEYILLNDNLYKLSLRTGVGGNFIFFYHISSPFMVNFIFGKTHNLDFGVGILLDYSPKQKGYNLAPQAVKFIGNIGYRVISKEDFIFRIGFTPIYFYNQGVIPLIGISFGHYF